MKSLRSVSMPESSCASVLKAAAISSKPSSPNTPSGGMRTEKSPRVIFSAARRISRTGRVTIKRRRTSSAAVHSRLRSSTLTKVRRAAPLICAWAKAKPSVVCSRLTNSVMQQLMRKAMLRKKVTYRRSASPQARQRPGSRLI